MADPQGASQPETQGDAGEEQHELLTLDDRANLEKLAIFARRDMLAVDDKVDQWKVADEIESTITEALVRIEADRTKVGITPTRLMELHFPEVPKRSEIESEDEEELELTDLVYGKCKSEVFRVLNIMPGGPIQSRLSNNGDGLVLCRMKGRKGAEEVAYVTRNKKCIQADNNDPALHSVELAIAKAAALTGMSIERVREHGKWFRNQYKASMTQALGGGDNTVQLALELPEDNGSEGDGSEGDE